MAAIQNVTLLAMAPLAAAVEDFDYDLALERLGRIPQAVQ